MLINESTVSIIQLYNLAKERMKERTSILFSFLELNSPFTNYLASPLYGLSLLKIKKNLQPPQNIFGEPKSPPPSPS